MGQATQLVDIQRERQLYKTACRGSNQQLKGLGQRRGHLQHHEEGSQRRRLRGEGKKAFSKQRPKEVNVQAGGKTKETTGVAREEGI